MRVIAKTAPTSQRRGLAPIGHRFRSVVVGLRKDGPPWEQEELLEEWRYLGGMEIPDLYCL